ncbi:unnamed protein product [Schistosoma curassoni]|uniref:PH domain-containing protein n=1 Tax=Schistosoma curassoni TaxID=6186 RepID=A0A183JST7_9TREM|nr:unnamed protein product [Schistosoma curassoni]VDO98290.1 unnamed protein product [Schistosoma curassoni]
METREQRNRWVKYLEELLNRPAPLNPPVIEATHTDIPIDVTPSTIEEIRMSIRQIRSGKAAGPDDIPAAALKSDIEVATTMFHLLFKEIWEEEYDKAFDSVGRRILWKIIRQYGVRENC